MQSSKTQHHNTSYLWDGNRQLQQNTATHTHTIIYEQDSFEPVAQFIWLRDGLTAANDEPKTNDEGWYGNNKPVIKTGVQLYHYHNDHLGTPNELTDQQGDVVWYADYEAWGNTATVEWKSQRIDNIVVSEEHLQPIRFQGQSFDTETGLHYNRFRYFDPDMGMFTTRDPIGLMGGSNVFQYAPNPTGWIDPFGLSCTQPRNEKGHFQSPKQGDLSPGKDFESIIEQRLLGNSKVRLLGTQVAVRTKLGIRYMDALVQRVRDGKLFHIEVKSNSATRSSTQKAKDALIDKGEGVFVDGKNVPIGLANTTTDNITTIISRPKG